MLVAVDEPNRASALPVQFYTPRSDLYLKYSDVYVPMFSCYIFIFLIR